MTLVTFAIECQVPEGAEMCVLGKYSELGSWRPHKAIPLMQRGKNFWVTSVEVPEGKKNACRFLIRSKESGYVLSYEVGPEPRKFRPRGKHFDLGNLRYGSLFEDHTMEHYVPETQIHLAGPLLARDDEASVFLTIGNLVHRATLELGDIDTEQFQITLSVATGVDLQSWREGAIFGFGFRIHTSCLQHAHDAAVFHICDGDGTLVGQSSLTLGLFGHRMDRSSVPRSRSEFATTIFSPSSSGEGLGDPIGSLLGEFTVCHPFVHRRNTLEYLYRKNSFSSTQYVGHRGLGKSFQKVPGVKQAEVRENTLMSFTNTSLAGAAYAELDVMLSCDRVPVVFHDFRIGMRARRLFDTESEVVAIGIHDLTVKQLKMIDTTEAPHFDRTKFLSRPASKHIEDHEIAPEEVTIPLSCRIRGHNEFSEQLRQCLFDINGEVNVFENVSTTTSDSTPVSRATTPQPEVSLDRFAVNFMQGVPTLKEVLLGLPPNLGLNIEVKFPLEHEDELLGYSPAFEMNAFLDSILDVVFSYAPLDRPIIFSCFHPDACLMLRLKQARYPVYFLTSSGMYTTSDKRCNSLEAARLFAQSARLDGIVCNSGPFFSESGTNHPGEHEIEAIKAAGLHLFTWGVANSDPIHCKLQEDWGVDGVICDNVQDMIAFHHQMQDMGIET